MLCAFVNAFKPHVWLRVAVRWAAGDGQAPPPAARRVQVH